MTVSWVDEFKWSNRKILVFDLASELNVFVGSVDTTPHNNLSLVKASYGACPMFVIKANSSDRSNVTSSESVPFEIREQVLS
jgi:hypothetical protein